MSCESFDPYTTDSFELDRSGLFVPIPGSEEFRDDTTINTAHDLIDFLNELFPEIAGDYDHFVTEAQRKNLFTFTKATAEYIQENEIAAVALIDRSARPFATALHRYWDIAYGPNDPALPPVFFINPKGFRNIDSDTVEEMLSGRGAYITQDREEAPHLRRRQATIEADVASTLGALLEHKDSPVLLVDTCLHTGITMQPVVDTLENVGFRDIQVAVVHSNMPEEIMPENLKPRLIMTKDKTTNRCLSFGPDYLTQKVYGSVVSEPSEYPSDRTSSRLLRKEIARVIQEQAAVS